jgi:hypothetical protein
MADFVHTATNIFFDEKEKPVAWTCSYAASNFNAAVAYIPAMGEILKRARKEGARVLLIDGLSIDVAAAAAGLLIGPRIYGDPTASIQAYLAQQTSISLLDRMQWEPGGFPIGLSHALSTMVGRVAIAGYGATDDLTLTMWGRFA